MDSLSSAQDSFRDTDASWWSATVTMADLRRRVDEINSTMPDVATLKKAMVDAQANVKHWSY